jgi:hypothetical protein
MPPQPPTLPANSPWKAVWDKESEDYYFWNTSTQETSWDNPHEEDGAQPDSPPAKGSSTATERSAEKSKLERSPAQPSVESKTGEDDVTQDTTRQQQQPAAEQSENTAGYDYSQDQAAYAAYYQQYYAYYGAIQPPTDVAGPSTAITAGYGYDYSTAAMGSAVPTAQSSAQATANDDTAIGRSGQYTAESLADGYKDYSVAGYFNPRTGRFESQSVVGMYAAGDLAAAQELRSHADSKNYRQMNQYFDYKSWVEQRNSAEYLQEEQARKNKKPTKKDIQQFKQHKKERVKAKRRWLFED